jgi:hypothetical protein
MGSLAPADGAVGASIAGLAQGPPTGRPQHAQHGQGAQMPGWLLASLFSQEPGELGDLMQALQDGMPWKKARFCCPPFCCSVPTSRL